MTIHRAGASATALFALLLALLACAPAPTATPVPTATSIPPTPTPPPPTDTPTPSPTATSTPTPRPTLTSTPASDTSVVLTDDYGLNCLPPTLDDADRSFKCEDGEYTMLSKAGNQSWWVFYRDQYDDSVIEVDLRSFSDNPAMDYGVVFRMSGDGSSGYAFLLSPDGSYAAYVYARPKWDDLIASTRSSAIKTGTAKNRIKVVAQGNQIAFYANDEFLNTVSDDTAKTGSIGFMVGNRDPNAKVAFDNLVVSKINRSLSLPQPRATATPEFPPIPEGMGGLIVNNYMGEEVNFTISGKLYKIPGNGRVVIHLPPGRYPFSFNTATGVTAICGSAQGCIVEIQLGRYATQGWTLQR